MSNKGANYYEPAILTFIILPTYQTMEEGWQEDLLPVELEAMIFHLMELDSNAWRWYQSGEGSSSVQAMTATNSGSFNWRSWCVLEEVSTLCPAKAIEVNMWREWIKQENSSHLQQGRGETGNKDVSPGFATIVAAALLRAWVGTWF